MLVEHYTLGDKQTLWDIRGVSPETIQLLKNFQIKEGNKTVSYPNKDLQADLEVKKEGALFHLRSPDQKIKFTSVCCFEKVNSEKMLKLVRELNAIYSRDVVIIPIVDKWIYSVPIEINMRLRKVEREALRRIEFLIYHSLYLARI